MTSTYKMTLAETRAWNKAFDEAYDEYRKTAQTTSNVNLLNLRAGLRLTLKSDADNAYASGALVAVTSVLVERNAL